LTANPNLLWVAGVIVVFQAIIVTFLGPVFNTEPLAFWDWIGITVATSSVLVLGELARWMRRGNAELKIG